MARLRPLLSTTEVLAPPTLPELCLLVRTRPGRQGEAEREAAGVLIHMNDLCVCVCSPPTLDRDAGGEEKSLGRKNEEDLPPLRNTREGNRQTWVRLSLQIILCFCFNVGVQYAAAET